MVTAPSYSAQYLLAYGTGCDASALNDARSLGEGGADVAKIANDSKVSGQVSIAKNATQARPTAEGAAYQKTERMNQTALERQRMDTRLVKFGNVSEPPQ
jgi:hypothetical protein